MRLWMRLLSDSKRVYLKRSFYLNLCVGRAARVAPGYEASVQKVGPVERVSLHRLETSVTDDSP